MIYLIARCAQDELKSLPIDFGERLLKRIESFIIFVHPEIPELLNLQNVAGQAKPYPMKQLIKIVEKHNLRMETSE
jgi:hypothetical protein